MSDTRWQRVKDVLAAALDETSDRRPALLDVLCAGDVELRTEVESLLQADAASDTFLQKPLLTEDDHSDVEEPEPHLGRQVGVYVIEQHVGRGGMGSVYLAR